MECSVLSAEVFLVTTRTWIKNGCNFASYNFGCVSFQIWTDIMSIKYMVIALIETECYLGNQVGAQYVFNLCFSEYL